MKKISIFLFCFVSVLLIQAPAGAVPVDLNDFWSAGNISIAPDGSSATLTEDPNFGSAYLSNDPFFEDPGIYIPLDSTSLTFDYNFDEPDGNFDEFYAFLFDPFLFDPFGNHIPLLDENGNALEFFTDKPGSGTVTWDLLGADFLGDIVGMEFQLNYDPFNDPLPSANLALNSSVTISNVNINPVPEPATSLLVLSGLAGLFAARRTKQKRI